MQGDATVIQHLNAVLRNRDDRRQSILPRCPNAGSVEQLAMPQLREAIPYCEGVRDFVTRDLFSKILKGEEKHVDFLETQLELIGKIGREDYTQLQAEPSG
jgi:bacterioferritin